MNISLSLLILLISMNIREALEISVFPSLLLITTLFRLALSVSSTRLILLTANPGRIILAFGEFVVGGNYVVGFVIFFILVVVQFIVITKGAERVAEVAARFTLDAMPGKQMSIDADLNAGLITEGEARQRRQQIAREADFTGPWMVPPSSSREMPLPVLSSWSSIFWAVWPWVCCKRAWTFPVPSAATLC